MKLREMKIDFLDDVNSFDSVALNEERKKLIGARSVTIYLNKRRKIYLTLKRGQR